MKYANFNLSIFIVIICLSQGFKLPKHLSNIPFLSNPRFCLASSGTTSPTYNNFMFVTCQIGAEKLLKEEMLLNYPDLRLAFSRPGMLTYKSLVSTIPPTTQIKSTFTQSYGTSVGQASNIKEVIDAAKNLRNSYPGSLAFRLHVYLRHLAGAKNDHPLAIEKRNQYRETTYHQLLQAGDEDKLWILSNGSDNLNDRSSSHEMANNGEHIFNVIIGEETEKFFLGHHIHSNNILSVNQELKGHSQYPGGILHNSLPPEAPSRAYLKVEEAILLNNLQSKFEPNDVVLEIGSAPGGASYYLLNQGCIVYGVDPCPQDRPHAPIVLNHKNFKHIHARLESIPRKELPPKIDWLLCDANITPYDALPNLLQLVKNYKYNYKGILFTCKLNDDLWNSHTTLLIKQYIPKLLVDVKMNLGLSAISSTQLSTNRQEILIAGLTDIGLTTSGEN